MKKTFGLANIITLFRIALIPVFMVFYLNTNLYIDNFPLVAMLVFLLAVFSDVLDGLIARNMHTVTMLGKVLDPLADKLLRLSVLCAFWIMEVLPLPMFIILLSIDLLSIIFAGILYIKKIVIPANTFGKITTIYMSIALFSCFFHSIIAPYDMIAVSIGLGLVILTVVQYLLRYIKIYNSL